MPVIHPNKHKFIVVLVAALASFLGFQAAGAAIGFYQIETFLLVAFLVYLFLVFWQTFVFDIHLRHALQEFGTRFGFLLKKHHWIHFQNYLILPGIVYWATIALLFLNPFDQLPKQVWIILSTLALAVSFWYLKTVFYQHDTAKRYAKQRLFLVKLYASYIAFASSLGLGFYFGPLASAPPDYFAIDAFWYAIIAFSLTFILFYQALFQHHHIRFESLKLQLASGAILGIVGYLIYQYWNVNYYSGALVLAAVYNAIWGIVQHKFIDRDLTREIAYEYLAVLFVILVIVISTTNFAQRV